MPEDARTVYSTGRGRICPRCGRPVARCRCRAPARAPQGDGIVRVRREVRRGKSLVTIHGLPLAPDALRELARELKRMCASGGAAKDGVIELQGDQRDAVISALEARGYTVKRAGG